MSDYETRGSSSDDREEEGAPRPSSPSEEGEEDAQGSRKRPRPSGDGEDEDCRDGDFPAKVPARSRDIIFRIVVPSVQIGRVIGVKGSQIRRIREETRATIKIADAVTPFEERVIIISSRDDECEVSDAERALQYIAKIILQDDNNGMIAPRVGTGHSAKNMIRLLIAGSQAGCLIGVSGHSIAEIRNSSGATVQIMAPNHLPSCASAHESDRLVQVSGDIAEVLKALERIGYKLREKPPKRVISIRPTYNFSAGPAPYLTVPSADTVTSEILISESMVGGLIGKHGSNISNFRAWSGATIRVIGERGERPQRHIRIEGSADQVAAAKMLVENYISSQVNGS
ncbi:flowering locus K homology domain-like [Nymphaea colorata]|nr:flowering locus K homology domain-like [Nymphaea colorata]